MSRPNLIANFLDFQRPDVVEDLNDIAMHRQHFGADGNLQIWIGVVELGQPLHDLLVVIHGLVFHVIDRPGCHTNRDEVFYLARRERLLRWQINFDALHVGLAQAHHHETGEQE